MKIVAIIFLISLSLLCHGQKKDEIQFVNQTGPPIEATYVLVLDTTRIMVDYEAIRK